MLGLINIDFLQIIMAMFAIAAVLWSIWLTNFFITSMKAIINLLESISENTHITAAQLVRLGGQSNKKNVP